MYVQHTHASLTPIYDLCIERTLFSDITASIAYAQRRRIYKYTVHHAPSPPPKKQGI